MLIYIDFFKEDRQKQLIIIKKYLLLFVFLSVDQTAKRFRQLIIIISSDKKLSSPKTTFFVYNLLFLIKISFSFLICK